VHCTGAHTHGVLYICPFEGTDATGLMYKKILAGLLQEVK
jgi:hypothetical protein